MPRVSLENNPRFTMEIPPFQKARLMRAASVERTSLKDFLLRHALQAADGVLERTERITLSEHDTRKILDLLDHPGEANPHMVAVLRSRSS